MVCGERAHELRARPGRRAAPWQGLLAGQLQRGVRRARRDTLSRSPRPPGGRLRSPRGSRVVTVTRTPGRPQTLAPFPGGRWPGQDSGGNYGDQIRERASPGRRDIDPGHIQGAEESWGTPCNATRNKTQLADGPKPTQQGELWPSSLTLPLFRAHRLVGESRCGRLQEGEESKAGGRAARGSPSQSSASPRPQRRVGGPPLQPPSPSGLRRPEPLYNSPRSAGGVRAPIASGLPLTQALRRPRAAPAGRGVRTAAGGCAWRPTPRPGDTPRQLGKLGREWDEIKGPRAKSLPSPSPACGLRSRAQAGGGVSGAYGMCWRPSEYVRGYPSPASSWSCPAAQVGAGHSRPECGHLSTGLSPP